MTFLVIAELRTGRPAIKAAVCTRFADEAKDKFFKAFVGKRAKHTPLLKTKRDVKYIEAVPVTKMTKAALLRTAPGVYDIR